MITIRRFTNQDFDLVSEFYRRSISGDIERKTKAFKWIQTANPFSNNEDNYALIFLDGKLIGYWGVMPVKFYYFGAPFLALFSQETLVDPAYRRQGIAASLLDEINRSSQLMISMWHNEKILAIKRKAGWSNIGKYKPLKKIYNLDNLLKLKLRNGSLSKILARFSIPFRRVWRSENKRLGDYDIQLVEKCSSQFDHFFADVAPKLGILSDRSSATLNWKYIDIPHKQYLFLTARKKGNICAYVVLRIEEQDGGIRKGIIVDLLCDPDEPEALLGLAGRSDEIFREGKVDFSVCLVQPEKFRNVFKKTGYHEAKSGRTDSLWIYNEDKGPNKDMIKDMSNWYITYGESDGDVW